MWFFFYSSCTHSAEAVGTTPELIFEALNSLSYCQNVWFLCGKKIRLNVLLPNIITYNDIQYLYYNKYYNSMYIGTWRILFEYECLQFLNIIIITQSYYFRFIFCIYNNYFKMFLFLWSTKFQKNIGYFLVLIVIWCIQIREQIKHKYEYWA